MPSAPRFFGTNVKMHQTVSESIAYIDALAALGPHPDLQLFVIVPFTSLAAIAGPAKRAGIWIGAQNMHWATAGEYTGEVSAPMLRDIGVDLVLLGHAERRGIFGESDLLIRQKVEAALTHGLRVVLCVGDTAEERRSGAAAESVVRQLKLNLHGAGDPANVIVAYEPVWAIGAAGSPPDAATIGEITAAIRTYSSTLPLLYGGSVTAESAPGFAAVAGIDGLFVGRAARSASGFEAVARAAYPAFIGEHENIATVQYVTEIGKSR